DEELSDEGSPRVIVYGYNGLPMLPVAPPLPDYIPGPEEPQTPPAPQDEDEHEPIGRAQLPAKEQPLPPVVSPAAESPGYVAESDPEEKPAEYEDDKTVDGPVDYLMDAGDDGDDDDDDSSGDNADDEDKDEEEEEHLAPADSVVVIPTDKLVSPPEGADPVIPPPSTDTATTGARITRLCLSTLGSRYEVRERSTARPTGGRGIDYGFVSTLDAEARRQEIGEVGYGIRDTWVDPTKTVPEIVPMTVGERVDLLIEDRIAHQETIQIVEDEAYAVREAWAHSTGLSNMHAKLLALHEQPRRAGQPGGDARVPNHHDAPRDADSHI
nr:hypothetical protein [Tanacetum cinerariifolium]